MTKTLTFTLLASLTIGCASVPKRVVRDSSTYTAEILSSLQREREASAALHRAAALVPLDECAEVIAPALLIDAAAQRQAYAALWLAGLPYPLEDGSIPDPKAVQADPNEGLEAPIPHDAEAYCNDQIHGGQ